MSPKTSIFPYSSHFLPVFFPATTNSSATWTALVGNLAAPTAARVWPKVTAQKILTVSRQRANQTRIIRDVGIHRWP